MSEFVPGMKEALDRFIAHSKSAEELRSAAVIHDGYAHGDVPVGAMAVLNLNLFTSTCKRCGVSLLPTIVGNVLTLHDAWHSDLDAAVGARRDA